MKADAYFEIGATHLICQDYAVAFANDDYAYAIVSDGCTSSPNTDIGARLISVIAKDAINYLYQRGHYDIATSAEHVVTLKELIIKKCLEVKGSLNLPVDAFDATLLIAVIYKTYPPLIFGWGDGNFIIKYKDGMVRTLSLSYDGNMPYYLSYQMSYEKDQAYKQQQVGKMHVAQGVYNFPMGDPRIGSFRWKNETQECKYDFNFIHFLNETRNRADLAEISSIVVSSDGLQSFQFDPRSDEFKQNDKVFPLSEIYPKIIDYKNPVGEFAVRRMKSLEKENRLKHIIHYDDVSCAAIVMD